MKTARIFGQRARITALVFIVPMLTAAGLRAEEIHTAAAAGDLNKVRALIEADPTLLESKGNDGFTPLISACFATQVAVANFLIDKGANVNAKNNWGGTPLYLATKNFDLMQRLIAKGAEVNVKAFGNFTPLHQAASSGNLKVAKLLIDHGADLNARGGEGTVLHRIINRKSKSNGEMAKLLLESGVRLQEFSFGNTELHLAAMKGLSDMARVLVEHGADVNAVNGYGHTPLYYAAKHGYRSLADILIAAGAKKSAIGETNYGKAPQLAGPLKEGEAYLWFLGGLPPGTGYALKTKEHLLIFDPSGIDESLEAGLANGYLNPQELAGQKITILITRPQRYMPDIFELEKRLPGADFVFAFKPTDGNGYVDTDLIPSYRLAAPNESFVVGGVQVHTIPALLQSYVERAKGLGYLVEADGVKIFHAGLHASGNGASQMEEYRKQVDFLKSFGPIDIAILPIKGVHVNIAYEPYLYLLDQLSPKAVYLIGDDLVSEEHRKCVEVLRARNIPVAYPEGGIALGERFHYLREPAQKRQAHAGSETVK